ncbi:MAG: class I SAM-dependent methyltransferase [Caldilineaceae bacterium]
MQPANDPTINYKALVQQNYDRCAAAYEAARRDTAHPELTVLIDRLPSPAQVLDIGCGAGVPVAQTLAQHFVVTGVDISAEQIRRAQNNVPNAQFIHSDIMALDFPAATFDAVVSFYAIFHLPREEHPELLRRIYTWLKPGGYLLATVTQFAEAAYTEDDFFGGTMYWSNYGLADYRHILQNLGFTILDIHALGHGYNVDANAAPERHPLLFAQRNS